MFKQTLERTGQAITNGQSRYRGNVGHKTQNEHKKNKNKNKNKSKNKTQHRKL